MLEIKTFGKQIDHSKQCNATADTSANHTYSIFVQKNTMSSSGATRTSRNEK